MGKTPSRTNLTRGRGIFFFRLGEIETRSFKTRNGVVEAFLSCKASPELANEITAFACKETELANEMTFLACKVSEFANVMILFACK